VAYPNGGTGDAVVLLEIVVATDGTVSEARVLEGEEPFAEQARQAVLRWEFTPAMRGTEPVAARIRARVEFHQEPTAGSAATGTTPAAAVAAASQPVAKNGPPTPEAPLDVTVRGQRREIGETTLSAADAREMPGAFGDPFRAIEALPGVAPVLSGLPYFYIRGAPPNDNGYYLDGVRVPLLFHVGIGDAVIHPALIDRVDFFPSAAPAAYGGWAGAIIAGQTREPATEAHGQANIRLFDAGGLVETPFDGGKGSVLLAGRYGYPGPILSAITSRVKLGYWDYQARATWRLSDRDTLGVFAFGSHDYLGSASSMMNGQPGPIVEELGSDFHRVDLRYDRALSAGHLRIAATLGYDRQGGAGATDGAAPATIRDRSAALRLEMNERLSPALLVRGGVDAHYDTYDFVQAPPTDTQVPVPSSADPPPTNMTAGVHADVVWRIGSRVEIVPGARVDVFESSRPGATGGEIRTTVPAFDPRLSARVAINSKVAWLITAGVAHQYPALRVGPIPALLLTVPGFPFGDSELQTARQLSTGVEASLPADISLTATGFLSSWTGLTDLNARCLQILPPTMPPQYGYPPPTPYTCPDSDPVQGYAYGAEILVRRSLSKRLAGWLSYTLSQSRRDEHFVTLSGGDVLANVTSDFDRTHIVNAVLAYDLGRHWRAGARFVFYSGAPYSNLSGNVPVPPYNGYRGPPFYRLDVRLEKRWKLGKTGSLAFVLEGQNVTLSKETSPEGLKCFSSMIGPQGGTDVTNQCSEGTLGPLTIPSVGVEAVF
jgi:TonB family protein